MHIFKKRSLWVSTSLIVLGLLISPKLSFAAGTFQVKDFNPKLSAIAGQSYLNVINFIYSGDFVPAVSITGNPNLPPGMKLGTIMSSGNGVDSIVFSGVASSSGDYQLDLILTDNNGALLDVPFDFNVVDNAISIYNYTLPTTATVNQPYSASVSLNFVSLGKIPPIISLWGSPSWIQAGAPTITWINNSAGSEVVSLFGTPTSTGQFQINFSAQAGGVDTTKINTLTAMEAMFGKEQYTVNVESPVPPQQSTPVSIPAPTNQTSTGTNNKGITLPAKISTPPPAAPMPSVIATSTGATTSLNGDETSSTNPTNQSTTVTDSGASVQTQQGFFSKIGTILDSLITSFLHFF